MLLVATEMNGAHSEGDTITACNKASRVYDYINIHIKSKGIQQNHNPTTTNCKINGDQISYK